MADRSPRPLVSVVTPVHNTEPYLATCLDSILAQDYDTFELIIVENQSTDGSADIAHDYARKDDRVRVVETNTLLPQVQNFNFALSQISAASRFTKMVLADDWIHRHCLGEMVDLAVEHPGVGLVSSYRFLGAKGVYHGLPLEVAVIPGKTAGRQLLLESIYLLGSQSTVMYRSDHVRARAGDFFRVGHFFCDTEAALEILKVSDFGFVHQILSFSREQDGSVTDAIAFFDFWLMHQFAMVTEFGSHFLTPSEQSRATAHAKRALYDAMGRQWLFDRGGRRVPGFWDFQRSCLDSVDTAFSNVALAKGVGRTLLRAAASPVTAIRSIDRRSAHAS